MKSTMLCSLIVAGLFAAPAFAQSQSAAGAPGRDVNQQKRIEAGLQSGALTTREAARLERGEARIDRAESRALRDGNVTPDERHRIAGMQNEASRDLWAQTHDRQTGNPDSASSRRMQADVARNIRQEQRIGNGVANGSLTNREAGRLERGQARIDRREAFAGRDGHVSAHEQGRIQHWEGRQSQHIQHERHDRWHRG